MSTGSTGVLELDDEDNWDACAEWIGASSNEGLGDVSHAYIRAEAACAPLGPPPITGWLGALPGQESHHTQAERKALPTPDAMCLTDFTPTPTPLP